MAKDNAKAAKAITRRALEKSGARQHSRGWNMTPAVRKLERERNSGGKKK
jgi:hypothetical protein